ncbi:MULTISPECIES: hypothetical protein [Stenotrophomonas]|jgi:hypothetical protein|uniref:hypothetical protein n=1 Tax=Stenotrophomonas TaxID=40323 RepID=UPI00066E8756|nr:MULTISPECIES: hypothetical protein [Stenotrophomonas]MBA0338771.1 hypothetical protein [Stenotrophomonas maltophilia]MBA0542864.1 hypothetical protein [Stenotrophomonas maltophilia]MBH1526125.1 hypothetical protein [Stenotrophomonas maltophilia]MBH1574460.1 hypothetical protein [Stenotrophomonas maltophilia]MBH1649911.1 hypothetical protein [Stenotrophomonas maltophilia]
MSWLKTLGTMFRRNGVTQDGLIGAKSRTNDLSFFWFLVDAPMAMDTLLIERFHDAVIRPESIVRTESEMTAKKETAERRLGAEGRGSGEVPFVVKLALKGKFEHRATGEDAASLTRQLDIPRTHERLLEEIVAFYLLNFPERVLRVDPVSTKVFTADSTTERKYEILDETCATPGPRPIVLIDAPKFTKIMPIAGEFMNGKLDVVYDSLIQALSTADDPLKRFARGMDQDKKAERWKELADRFDASTAMQVLEDAARRNDNSRFDWVDFRMAWGETGFPSPLHLHVVPNGRYPTGVFGHAFIRRAFSNGVRIVGTLKSGGDINVLAIYER